MNLSDFPFAKVILEIVEAADAGKLSFDEFHNTWPKSANGIEFFDQIYFDVEDAVEHFPGKFITRKPDTKTWDSTDEHYVLQVDMELLRSGGELSTLNSRRSVALQIGSKVPRVAR